MNDYPLEVEVIANAIIKEFERKDFSSDIRMASLLRALLDMLHLCETSQQAGCNLIMIAYDKWVEEKKSRKRRKRHTNYER